MSATTSKQDVGPRQAGIAVAAAASDEPLQFLTFMLGGEQFGLSILGIKEIIEYTAPTEVPMMPGCIRGVINIRGAVVPVLDLAARFGRKGSPVGKRTAIVIVELGTTEDQHDMGIVVDAVNAVVDFPASEIEPPPAFGTKIRTDFISGMGKLDGKFVILLNVEQVLSSEEISALTEVGRMAGPVAAEAAVS